MTKNLLHLFRYFFVPIFFAALPIFLWSFYYLFCFFWFGSSIDFIGDLLQTFMMSLALIDRVHFRIGLWLKLREVVTIYFGLCLSLQLCFFCSLGVGLYRVEGLEITFDLVFKFGPEFRLELGLHGGIEIGQWIRLGLKIYTVYCRGYENLRIRLVDVVSEGRLTTQINSESAFIVLSIRF